MQRFKVFIAQANMNGDSGYMQHRMDDVKLEEWEKTRKLIIERPDIAKEDQLRAEFHAYSDEKGFYIPTEHLIGAFINAGGMVRAKVGNAKKSMKNIVAGMFSIEEPRLRLPKEYIIDKRSAVNRNIKARVISIRPRWENWAVSFTLVVDNDTITFETIKSIIEIAGSHIGIGSFAPRHSGRFGRFKVVDIKKLT